MVGRARERERERERERKREKERGLAIESITCNGCETEWHWPCTGIATWPEGEFIPRESLSRPFLQTDGE